MGHAQKVRQPYVVGNRIALPEQAAAGGVERKDRIGVAGGNKDPAAVNDRRIQVPLAAVTNTLIRLLTRIGRHPERSPGLHLESNDRAQIRLVVKGGFVKRQQPMVEIARRGHTTELHRHAKKVVAVRRRGPQVADPAAGPVLASRQTT